MARKPLPPLRPRTDDGNIETASMYAAMAGAGGLQYVPIKQIVPNPNQPRRIFAPEALASLAASIDSVGLLQPPRVRMIGPDRYELIVGERRLRACQQLELLEIPVLIADADTPDRDSALAALAENLEREALNPVEEARAYATLIDAFDLTRQQLADRLARSRAAIANALRLLDLPDEVLDLLELGQLTARHGRTLLSEPDHTRRRQLGRQAATSRWSVAQLEQAIAAPGRKGARPQGPPADQLSAAEAHQETLARALRREAALKPRPRGGFRLTIDFNDLADLENFVSENG